MDKVKEMRQLGLSEPLPQEAVVARNRRMQLRRMLRKDTV